MIITHQYFPGNYINDCGCNFGDCLYKKYHRSYLNTFLHKFLQRLFKNNKSPPQKLFPYYLCKQFNNVLKT
jgi:hypothetical protein